MSSFFDTVFFNPQLGSMSTAVNTERRLADLRGVFADTDAFDRVLEQGNPVIYTVAGIEPANGGGDLHYGLGMIAPGRIGDEYFMTKGHLHTRREAAEVYIGLSGEGMMLLEDERTGESRLLPLVKDSVVYVPGYTAHRTINTGNIPLTYIGIYPADAGHDYAAIATKNFRMKVIVGEDGGAVMVERRVGRV